MFCGLRESRRRSRRELWVEDCLGERKSPLAETTATHVTPGVNVQRLFFFRLIIAVGFVLFLLRLGYLQVARGQQYRRLAESNRRREIPIPAERGNVFDRRGAQLTANVPKFSLAVRPADVPQKDSERDRSIARLAELTGKTAKEIELMLEDYRDFGFASVVLLDDIPYDTAIKLLIAAADLPGISILRGSKRSYLGENDDEENMSLSHIIGFEGKINKDELVRLADEDYLPSDTVGRTGLEKMYQKQLRGDYGFSVVEVNALGAEQTTIEKHAPIPGAHVRTTIDRALQNELERILRRQLTALKKTRAAAVVLDPRSGDVMALVSLPAFDNNDFAGGITSGRFQNYADNADEPLFNRAISGEYPSGSTIKPALATGALQNGVITAQTKVLSSGGIRVGSWFFPDWLAGGHGATDVRKSLAWSVNTFYYYIGGGYRAFTGLGIDGMREILGTFNFGRLLGIDLPGEAAGFIPSPDWKKKSKGEQWYIGDTYNLSIGQGDLLVTPLQISAMTGAIANGGKIYRPRLLKAIIDPLTGAEDAPQPEVIGTVRYDDKHFQSVRLGMRDCVLYGSCSRLNSLPVAVAGKTGTAQWSSTKDPHAWFTSFAPFENPEIIATILIEEGGEGGSAAAPAAEEFYRWWYTYARKG